MTGMLTGMMMILATWGIGLLVFSGIGLLVQRLMGHERRLLSTFWIGFAFTLLFLQIWHLFMPVNVLATLCITALGVAGLLMNARRLASALCEHKREVLLGGAALLFFAVWLSNRAMGPMDPLWSYDAGLYHWNAIRWANTYRIVPGLGNLSGRLAFNSSFHLYEALINVGVWQGRCHHVTTGMIMMAAMTLPMAAVTRVILRPADCRTQDMFRILMIAPLVRLAFERVPGIVLPLPVFVMGFVLADGFLRLLAEEQSAEDKCFDMFMITLVAAAGVTIKLSLVVLGVLVVVVAFFCLSKRPSRVQWGWLLLPPSLLIAVWVVRGYVLSGYPAYPCTVAGIDVDWLVPAHQAEDMTKWIQSWARMPKLHHSEVLGNRRWLGPWLDAMWTSYVCVLVPLLMMVAGGFALFLGRKKPGVSCLRVSALLIPSLGGLTFWFFSAPAPRFAGILFWMLGASLFSLALLTWQLIGRRSVMIAVLVLSLTITLVAHWTWEKFADIGPEQGWYPVPVAETTTFITRSGLELTVPVEGDQNWDAPLPCTPYPNPRLRLRRAGDLQSGFVIDGNR